MTMKEPAESARRVESHGFDHRRPVESQRIDSLRDECQMRKDRRMAIAFTLGLWLMLLVPGDSVQQLPGRFDFLIPPHADKLVHCGLFALECVFLARWFRHLTVAVTGHSRQAVWLAAGALALATEAGQAWVPQRSADPWDVLADLAGIALWTVIGMITRRAAGV